MFKNTKRRGHTEINRNTREALYNWIIYHTKVMQYPNANYRLYIYIDGKS